MSSSGRHRAWLPPRRRLRLVAVVLLLAAVVAAALLFGSGRGRLTGSGSLAPASAVASPAAVVLETRAPAPVRLRIAAIGVDTGLQRLGLQPDGSLQPPSHWAEAGWYARGIAPGQIGPALIVGHIDSTRGPAVFYRLPRLRPGARVLVTTAGGRVLTFVVDGARRFAKARFPTATVYAPTPDAELRLVTCTGRFDAHAHSYLDNLVVSAHLV